MSDSHPTSPTSLPTSADLTEALATADGWAEHGYTLESRAYWAGMRDTLKVVLGLTTEMPRETGPGTDSAALTILGAQQRRIGR